MSLKMRFRKGSKVEVLSKKEVPSGSWYSAEIICGSGQHYTVRYDMFEGGNNQTVVERVSRKAIRPCPPSQEVVENWIPGDVVEVFSDRSWKMATVSEVLGKNNFLVRLLGSSAEFKVSKFDIRARRSWQDDKWVLVGIGKRSFNHGDDSKDKNASSRGYGPTSQIQKINSRINRHINVDNLSTKNKNFQESQGNCDFNTLKRGPIFYSSEVETVARAGAGGKCGASFKKRKYHRVVAAIQRDVMRGKHKDASWDRTGIFDLNDEKNKQTDAAYHSFNGNFELKDVDRVTSSVGSCSISNNSDCHRLPCHVFVARHADTDASLSDAESFCHPGYIRDNIFISRDKRLEAELHRLELHAYRCTMQALYASGPLSWEKELLLTDLRLSLHISNEEHLMEIKNLVSTNTNIQVDD